MSSTRNKLIELLFTNKDRYVSGQDLSEELSISRSAVWKHMNELKKDGYEIEGVAKKGYKIIQVPNKVSENTLLWGLESSWLGKTIIHKESIDSTQQLAHQLALDGAEHGTIVIADEQTSSRGRMGRKWYSPKKQGIWMSIILRPNILPYLAPQLTLLTATVLANVFDEICNVQPQIKWPNDVLINKKKISGILTEMQAEQDQILYVIIGVGINVNQTKDDIENHLQSKVTSLKLETGKDWSMVPIVQQLLTSFEQKYDNFLHHGFDQIKRDWENYGFRLNERLQITMGKSMWEGIFLGIGEDGALIAKKDDGTIEKIYSAEIAWF